MLDYLPFADVWILADRMESIIQELACLLPLVSLGDACLDLVNHLPVPMYKLLGSFALLESFELTFDQVWDKIHSLKLKL